MRAHSAWHLRICLKLTNFKVLQNRQFSTDRDEARLQTLVYMCIKFESSSFIASDQTRLHKVLGIWKKQFDNWQFSTDRDKTLTRQDFRPWFIRVWNLKALAQLLHTKLACTKYPTSNGTDGRTDRRTDRRTSSTLYPLVFTGDNKFNISGTRTHVWARVPEEIITALLT